MTDTQLAVEKLSPFAWWSVLYINLSLMLWPLLGAFGIWRFFSGGNSVGVSFLLLALVGFAFREFFSALINGRSVRKGRYGGVVELTRIGFLWCMDAPKSAFRSSKIKKLLTEQARKTMEKRVQTESKDRHVIFAIGVEDTPDSYRLKVVHSCEDSLNCDRPRLHVYGWSQENDGAVNW